MSVPSPSAVATLQVREAARRLVIRATVAVASSRGLNDPDWQQNLTICDVVHREPKVMGPAVARAVVDVLEAYHHRDYNVLWLTLILLEALVKNGSRELHRGVADKRMVRILKKIAGKRITRPGMHPPPINIARDIVKHRVQGKVLALIQAWGPVHPRELTVYNTLFQQLEKKGVVFPPVTGEDKLPFTSEQKSEMVRRSQAAIAIPTSVKRNMESAKESVMVLEALLGDASNSAIQRDPEARQLAATLTTERETLSKEIEHLIGTGSEDEKLISALLLLHERIDNALARFEGKSVVSASATSSADDTSGDRSGSSRDGHGKRGGRDGNKAPLTVSDDSDDDSDYSNDSDNDDDDDDGHKGAGKECDAAGSTRDPLELGFDLISFAKLDRPAEVQQTRSLRDSTPADVASSGDVAAKSDDFLGWLLDGVSDSANFGSNSGASAGASAGVGAGAGAGAEAGWFTAQSSTHGAQAQQSQGFNPFL